MRRFERKFQRHPKRNRTLSEAELIDVIKRDDRRFRPGELVDMILWILLIMFIIGFIATFQQP